MGDFRAEAFFQGSTGLRPHVWRHHTGADSGRTKRSLSEYGGKLEGPVQKKTGVTEAAGVTECSQSETSQPETSQCRNRQRDSCRILTKGGENIRLPIE